MKTTFMANAGNIERKWFVVDADGLTLGRLAAEVAKILRGKHKPTFTPHVDTGDFVIVINAAKVKLTGKKLIQKNVFPSFRLSRRFQIYTSWPFIGKTAGTCSGNGDSRYVAQKQIGRTNVS